MAPRFLAVDTDDQEHLSYIEGDVPTHPFPEYVWDDTALEATAALIRELHEATSTFRVESGDTWRRSARAPWSHEIICHNDLAPYNTVYRDEAPVAFIDWDFAAPGTRDWDVAHALWRYVPITADYPDEAVEGVAGRMRLFCRAYGYRKAGHLPGIIVDRMLDLAGTVRERAAAGDAAFIAMLGTHHELGPLRDAAFVTKWSDILSRALRLL